MDTGGRTWGFWVWDTGKFGTSSSTECHPSFSHADFTSPEFYRVREIESASYLHMQWVVECKDALCLKKLSVFYNGLQAKLSNICLNGRYFITLECRNQLLVPCFPLVKNDYIENWDVSIFKDIKQLNATLAKIFKFVWKMHIKYGEIWQFF